ncbi:MAG: radical SAM protein [Candidatus Aenigmarchaeota archaeon]|nr:radical SAM protein [Candidatus Aenigmarchaeota archaeon]
MKILFIIPKIRSMLGDEKGIPGHPNVGIAYLSAFLKQHGIEVSVYDEGLEQKREKIFDIIQSFNPDIIGVNSFNYCYHYAYELISELKKRTDIPVVFGGPHLSAMGKNVIEETEADFGINGEAEFTLIELLKNLKNRDFSKIDGLIWKENGVVVENPNRELIKNLDSLPFPDYSEFDIERYSYTHEKKMPIITSRGCPYKCNFCSVRLSMGDGFRARSAENVVDEIEHWCKKGYMVFEINDDCFSFDLERAMKICDLIIERGLKIKYSLYNGIRVDRITKELLEKMKQSGCVFLSYGCEAGDDEILRNIRKGIKLEQVMKASQWAKEVGIKHSVNFIIGHPGETHEKAMKSIKFAKSLPCDFVNFYNLVPYPGTDLFKWIKENGRFLKPPEVYLRELSYRDTSPVFETDDFTKEEREDVIKKGLELYEKTALQYRFGNKRGNIVFNISKIEPLKNFGINFALSNKIGRRVFHKFTSKSRE